IIYFLIKIEEGESMRNKIEVNNLNVSYYGNQALKNVSFSFDTGKLIGIIGPNGAGKSTLLKSMLQLIPKNSGHITIDDQPIKKIRRKIAYVPQRNDIDWDFPITVKNTVLLGTYPNLKLFHRPKKSDKEWALHCLEKVDMLDYQNRQIAELSGGQQQRVFLARALAQQADYFFLDEPFVGIDVAKEKIIIKILQKLRYEWKSVMVVHHDLSKIEAYFDDLILINKEVIETGTVKKMIQPEVMKQAYSMDFQLMN